MKCPKCGNELRKGLSFCPKCGEVISEIAKSEIRPVKVEKEKKPAWLIVLGVLFFPISLTYLIIKSKMKTTIKILLICVLWIFVILVGTSEESQDTGNLSDSQNEYSDVTEELTGETEEQETESNGSEEETVKYHTDEGVNQVFVTYNTFAENPITQDMVKDGAYDDRASVTN